MGWLKSTIVGIKKASEEVKEGLKNLEEQKTIRKKEELARLKEENEKLKNTVGLDNAIKKEKEKMSKLKGLETNEDDLFKF